MAFRIAKESDLHRSRLLDAPGIGGAPEENVARSEAWVRKIKRTEKTIVGIEVDAPTRSDVFIGADNKHVNAVVELVRKAKREPRNEDEEPHIVVVGALEYQARSTTENENKVVAYMVGLGGRRGPWEVLPIVVSSW
tara:strand:+ start:1565 stop:1975 length:411 start_codon:yes stop_codon:yes gene_type:complete